MTLPSMRFLSVRLVWPPVPLSLACVLRPEVDKVRQMRIDCRRRILISNTADEATSRPLTSDYSFDRSRPTP
jgi:hypothetical protein